MSWANILFVHKQHTYLGGGRTSSLQYPRLLLVVFRVKIQKNHWGLNPWKQKTVERTHSAHGYLALTVIHSKTDRVLNEDNDRTCLPTEPVSEWWQWCWATGDTLPLKMMEFSAIQWHDGTLPVTLPLSCKAPTRIHTGWLPPGNGNFPQQPADLSWNLKHKRVRKHPTTGSLRSIRTRTIPK